MFGEYKLNVKIEEEDLKLLVEGRGKRKRYYRKVGEEEVEKFIHADKGKLVVCPVEPVNLPKEGVSEYLLVELDKPLIIEPKTESSVYLKFPIEVGVFLVDEIDVERIDIFTKTMPKYILYGPPESGIICKWWNSSVYNEIPEVDKLYEGILRLDVKNAYEEWVEIKKVVLRAIDMKIFYDGYAYMHASLKILKKSLGETTFFDRLPRGMKRAIDIYLAKGIKRLEKKFVMEWGFK